MKKQIFIPGWMRSVAWYNNYEGVDIWKENIPVELNTEAEYIIAHSLGTVIALRNWEKFPQTKLILVDPLVLKRNFWEWMWRWVKFALDEGPRMDRSIGMLKIFPGLKKFYQLSKFDMAGVLKNVPKNNLVVICGCKDKYFCDDEAREYLKRNGIDIIEVTEAAHHWHEKFDEIINNLTK